MASHAVVGHVELLMDGRSVGSATYDFNRACLWSEVSLRNPSGPKRRATECDHQKPVAAWALLMEAAEAEFHWPVRYCPGCRTVLGGGRLRAPLDAMLEKVIAWDEWTKRWFKKGKPRRPNPPPDVTWPDAA